ncbi:hypothetical protein Pint_19963 [Pistacia integerrima]|uniref:Uncharacterized protein n=1 Tax=Pistacia integerrima TaxID=434235 RepID=A0ACC0XAA5_9ROSI|nr:hypothetical protein Pint_19963 [Pistacia integerrima]
MDRSECDVLLAAKSNVGPSSSITPAQGVHSLLGLTATATSIDSDCNKTPYKHKEGLGLIITATAETYRPPNVIESSLLKLSSSSPQPPAPSPLPPIFSMFSKKDPGGLGFIDDMGGGVNGLMSCTESLGFESSDERNVEDDHYTRVESPTRAKGRKDAGERRKPKKFPPPLSSFNRNGQPSFFLRSVRTDGRLELTEVRIDRPEILRASRQDGRLRLHLINEEEEEEEEEE